MAWIDLNRFGVFSFVFRYESRRIKKSLKTKDRRQAERHRSRVEENLLLTERGLMTIPEDVDIANFRLTDGRIGIEL